MAALQKLKVLEQCKIAPPCSVPSTTLPLTFFDIPWLLFSPTQPLFFFDFPNSTSHFLHSILPDLKLSLSLSLHRYFPLAGSLLSPPPPDKPTLSYATGDSISLTVAESAADFNYLSGPSWKEAGEFHHLVPWLPATSPCVLAIQVTVFPKRGVSVGFAFRSVGGDWRTFNNFLKCWASICRERLDIYCTRVGRISPFYDRSVIKDPNGLKQILLKQWWKLSSPADPFEIEDKGLKDMVRATFVVGRLEIDKLNQFVLARSKKLFGSDGLYLSPYVVTCACIWACLTKARFPNNKSSDEDSLSFGFVAGSITRLDYSVPETYLGNCVSFGRSTLKNNELVGENGIVIAAKAIGETVKKLNQAVLGGAESWISDLKELIGSDLHVMVTGSPKLDLYGLDFGWGRPKKIEEISIDTSGAVSLTESREVGGGIEVGLVLPKAHMDSFASLFTKHLNGLCSDY
ncbi:Anthocyanin 5-(6'''-hydroxycinnamoyltransferase) [Bertholletia excelsa]